MDKFEIELKCKKCDSTNVAIAQHLDFTGWEDCHERTGNIVLVCRVCDNKELVKLETEIVL